MQEYTITIAPRLYETDALGHINNATIAAWFEVARVRFLESLGRDSPASAHDWILASVHIDFVAETFYGSDVAASITEARVGNTSLTLDCTMVQDGRLTVRGKAVMVHMDAQSKTPERIPDGLRQALEAL